MPITAFKKGKLKYIGGNLYRAVGKMGEGKVKSSAIGNNMPAKAKEAIEMYEDKLGSEEYQKLEKELKSQRGFRERSRIRRKMNQLEKEYRKEVIKEINAGN